MGNMYEMYNLKEIKIIRNQAIDSEIGYHRLFEPKYLEIMDDLKVRLFDMFGIEE